MFTIPEENPLDFVPENELLTLFPHSIPVFSDLFIITSAKPNNKIVIYSFDISLFYSSVKLSCFILLFKG